MWAPFMKKTDTDQNNPVEPAVKHAIGAIVYLGYYLEFPEPIHVLAPDKLSHQIDTVMSQIYRMCNIENDPDGLLETQCVVKMLSLGKYKLPGYIMDKTTRPEYISTVAYANALAAFANYYKWHVDNIDMAPQDKLFYEYNDVILVYDKSKVLPYIDRYNEAHHSEGGNDK